MCDGVCSLSQGNTFITAQCVKCSRMREDEDLGEPCDEEEDSDRETNADNEEYIQSLERGRYKGKLPCLAEREIVRRSIRSPRDIEELEAAVRTVMRCDFGACAALETAAYANARNRALRSLRKPVVGGSPRHRIHLSATLLLEFNWSPPEIAIVERPHQTSIAAPNADSA